LAKLLSGLRVTGGHVEDGCAGGQCRSDFCQDGASYAVIGQGQQKKRVLFRDVAG
jgi:hypothetical protein